MKIMAAANPTPTTIFLVSWPMSPPFIGIKNVVAILVAD
jgi:hypothetical protein